MSKEICDEVKKDEFAWMKPTKPASSPGEFFITHKTSPHQMVRKDISDIDDALNTIGENLIKLKNMIRHFDENQKELLKKEYEYLSKILLPLL